MHIDSKHITTLLASIIGGLMLIAMISISYRLISWISKKIPTVRTRWIARNAEIGQREATSLNDSLRRLGLAEIPISWLLQASSEAAGALKLRYGLTSFGSTFIAGSLAVSSIKTMATGQIQPDSRPSSLISCVMVAAFIIRAQRTRKIKRLAFLLSLTAAIKACDDAVSSDVSDRHRSLKRLDDACFTVRRSLQRIHRISNSVRRGSPRERSAKIHAAMVVARLQVVEAQVDIKGDGGIRSLAALLAKIGNNFAAGSIGTLLPKQSLRGTKPAIDREGLRLTVVIVTTGAMLCLAPLVNLPAGLGTVLTGVAALLSATAAYGPRVAATKATEIMTVLRK